MKYQITKVKAKYKCGCVATTPTLYGFFVTQKELAKEQSWASERLCAKCAQAEKEGRAA